MKVACGCSCADLEAAASNAHLLCLKKHWNLRLNSQAADADLGQLLHQKMVKHEERQSSTNTEQVTDSRDCSGCLSFLLEAGVQLSTETPNFRLNALSSSAAAGCVSCLGVILQKLQLQEAISLALWEQAVGEASSCLKLEALRVLLDAAPGD